MLLIIESSKFTIFTTKKKDMIDLKECEVSIKRKNGLSENSKYMFTLNYKVKGLISQKQKKLTLGTDSEQARREWVFTL